MYTTSFNHLNIQLSMILEGTKNLLMSWYFLHNFCNRYKFNIVFNGLQVNNQFIHHFAWFLVWRVINDSMWFSCPNDYFSIHWQEPTQIRRNSDWIARSESSSPTIFIHDSLKQTDSKEGFLGKPPLVIRWCSSLGI